jgi:hypothetical protein
LTVLELGELGWDEKGTAVKWLTPSSSASAYRYIVIEYDAKSYSWSFLLQDQREGASVPYVTVLTYGPTIWVVDTDQVSYWADFDPENFFFAFYHWDDSGSPYVKTWKQYPR